MRALLVTALLLSSLSASAAEQPKLAVLEFEVQQGLSIDRRTFSSRLQNAARNAATQLFVMTQANIQMLLRSAGKKLEECEGECAVETGRLIGADIVISRRISKVGRTLAISMQMYETAKGRLLAGQDVEARNEDDLLKVASEGAARLLRSRGAKDSAGEPEGPNPNVSEERRTVPAEPRAAAQGAIKIGEEPQQDTDHAGGYQSRVGAGARGCGWRK